jgi:probable F420-dependent oxidoreductase
MVGAMQFSIQLPTDRMEPPLEFVSGEAVAEMARSIENAGFDACFVTEHPFPSDRWMAEGGHHALDPWVALSFAAAATTRLRLQTNIAVLAYRSPFLTAKSVASLDVLSGGRVIVGVAAGYLHGEFDALGADFARRNELTDEAIVAMKRAWTEEGITGEGSGWQARGNTMRPWPLQKPYPPLWAGGNSRIAIRRAVAHCDGWIPFPTVGIRKERVRTAAIETLADLAKRIDYARAYAREIGRTAPLDICFVPFGLSMRDMSDLDSPHLRDRFEELAALGVTWLTVVLPARTRADYCDRVRAFGDDVLAKL